MSTKIMKALVPIKSGEMVKLVGNNWVRPAGDKEQPTGVALNAAVSGEKVEIEDSGVVQVSTGTYSNSDKLNEVDKIASELSTKYTKPVMDWILGIDKGKLGYGYWKPNPYFVTNTPAKKSTPKKPAPSCACENCLGDLL